MKDLQSIGINVCKRHAEAESGRQGMASIWEALGKYARPSRDVSTYGYPGTATKSVDKHVRLFDSTLLKANKDHAAGTKAWMSPADSPWFQYDAPAFMKGNEPVEAWLSRCTEIAQIELAGSNFHTEEHEAILDGGAFGIRCLFVGDDDGELVFEAWEPGSFSIVENAKGFVDGIFRVQEFTSRQAIEKFGADKVPKSVNDAEATRPGNMDKERYIYAIYPRSDAERDGYKLDAENMPIASVWVHETSKHVCRNSGFEEMPAIASRYLKWSGSVYGLPPALDALADARQLNTLQEQLDILAEVAANPRLLLPSDLEGEVDMRAGGPTFFKDPNNVPRTWGTEGRYDIGQDRVAMRQQAIKDAFNLGAFQAFKDISKQMTAAEVYEIRKEKLDMFSPTFTLMTVEHYTPLLTRIFNILLRRGKFPPIPQELVIDAGDGTAFIPPPQVTFTSRIALAMKNVNQGAFEASLNRRQNLAGVIGPSAFDDLNVNMALREIDRNNGLPERWLKTPEEVAMIQQQRAQEAAQAQQMAMIQQGADALGKAGRAIGPEAMQQAAQQLAGAA